jgi:hypothetical protein
VNFLNTVIEAYFCIPSGIPLLIHSALCLLTIERKHIRQVVISRLSLADFVCLYNYEFGLSLCKIVRSSVILLLPLFIRHRLLLVSLFLMICVLMHNWSFFYNYLKYDLSKTRLCQIILKSQKGM